MNYSDIVKIVVDRYHEAAVKLCLRAQEECEKSGQSLGHEVEWEIHHERCEGLLEAYEYYRKAYDDVIADLGKLLDKELEEAWNEAVHSEK